MCPEILFSAVVAIIRVVTGHLVFKVRETGLEPVCLSTEDFKSSMYTIPSLSHIGTSLEN